MPNGLGDQRAVGVMKYLDVVVVIAGEDGIAALGQDAADSSADPFIYRVGRSRHVGDGTYGVTDLVSRGAAILRQWTAIKIRPFDEHTRESGQRRRSISAALSAVKPSRDREARFEWQQPERCVSSVNVWCCLERKPADMKSMELRLIGLVDDIADRDVGYACDCQQHQHIEWASG